MIDLPIQNCPCTANGKSKQDSLCLSLISCAARTWADLRDGPRFKIPIGEEGPTDRNLLDISRLNCSNVWIETFSKADESKKTGADWDWWLGVPAQSKWLGLRIQAKKLDTKEFRYKQINHGATGSNSQISLLIQSARSSKSPLVPMYCFYNFLPRDVEGTLKTLCLHRLFNRLSTRDKSLLGCTVASAEVVNKLPSAYRLRPEIIAPWSVPWHYLVCQCAPRVPPGHGLDLVDRLQSVLRRLDVAEEDMVPHGEPPNYVRQMMQGQPVTEPPSDTKRALVTIEDAVL